MVDKEGIALGVVLALAVQGLYDVTFYWMLGKIVEEWAAAMGVTVSLLLFVSMFLIIRSFYEKKPKRHEKQEKEPEGEDKPEGRSPSEKIEEVARRRNVSFYPWLISSLRSFFLVVLSYTFSSLYKMSLVGSPMQSLQQTYANHNSTQSD